MKYKYTVAEYERIRKIVTRAIAAETKAEAKVYIEQLRSMGREVVGYAGRAMTELTSAAEAASGPMRDKARKSNAVRQLLIKFKMFCVEWND